MKKKYMMFWEYDLFPYLLWGEIDNKVPEMLWKGKITYYVESYQSYFCPSFILPIKEGQILANLLIELKRQKKLEISKIDEEYNTRQKRILLENGVDL